MKITVLFLLVLTNCIFSQIDLSRLTGNDTELQYSNGIIQSRNVTVNEPQGVFYSPTPILPELVSSSAIRWSFTDAISIADRCEASSNGQLQSVGWGLNTERISLFNNSSSTPLWEFSTSTNTNINYTAISDAGDYIVSGSYHNVYVFNSGSSTPVFDFNLETQLPDTGIAGPVDITSNGSFIIACASRNDSSWIFGFNRTSTNWVWRYRVGQTQGTGGASIQGIKISGNDSLVVVNTYLGVYVFRTYTGEKLYSGSVNPSSTSGTQFPQAISGNGNYIATINYSGALRLLQWNGSTYNQVWQHVESGAWITAVDISFDGTKVACGTLNFLGGSNYDGKVKMFSTSSSTPLWTYTGCGDEVPSVSFSKDGSILAACSWGDVNNTLNDLLVFKTSVPAAAPVFVVNSPGSFFWCSASQNGSTVIASGKRVHARTFGNGGQVFNIFIDTSDTPLGNINSEAVPSFYELKQNYPNPFNPVTQINYSVPFDAQLSIKVYDALGGEVATLINKFHQSGRYAVMFDGSNLTSGVYYYRLVSDSYSETKKLVLVK